MSYRPSGEFEAIASNSPEGLQDMLTVCLNGGAQTSTVA